MHLGHEKHMISCKSQLIIFKIDHNSYISFALTSLFKVTFLMEPFCCCQVSVVKIVLLSKTFLNIPLCFSSSNKNILCLI